MAHATTTVRIRRPADVVFNAIEGHSWTNEPAWEPEVVRVRPLDGGAPRVGARVERTVRQGGKEQTSIYVFTALEPGRRIAVRNVEGRMNFALEILVSPAGPAAADVTAAVDISPRGAMRILAPMFAIAAPGRNKRITTEMARVIEASTSSPASGEALATA